MRDSKGEIAPRVLERIRNDLKMDRQTVLGYAAKMRSAYGDPKTAEIIERIAEERADPPAPKTPFFCYECGGSLCEHAPDQGLLKSPSWINDLEVTESEE